MATVAMHKNWFVVCLFFLLPVSEALLALHGKRAHAGDVLSAVRVLTDKATYARGERIIVTIHNELTTFLYAPPKTPYCSVISVQRLEGSKWVAKESCTTPAPSDPPAIIAIAPRSRTWGTLGEAARVPRRRDFTVSEPVKPFAAEENLRAPPPAESRKQGEPIPEIPEGGRRTPFSTLGGVLEPGRYRIEFTFTVGATRGPIKTVYSNEFAVIG